MEQKLEITPLSKHVGAEIRGVNLAADLPDDTFEKVESSR
jgi:alpha-ketoglutarate-dependent taurine dioxygenase